PPSAAEPSAVGFGKARKGVSPDHRSRHSRSLGARTWGSWLQPPSPRTAFRRERTSAGTETVIGRDFSPPGLADKARRTPKAVVDRFPQPLARNRRDRDGLAAAP